MKPSDLIEAVTARLRDAHPPVRALLLVGSFGRGTADRFSDVDLLAAVERDQHERFTASWRAVLEAIAPVVFWNQRASGDGVLINAVSEAWLRCDLAVVTPDAFAARTRDAVTVLFDRDGLSERMPLHRSPARPRPARLFHLVQEFIRVLGLLPVVAGRGEWVTGAGSGIGHLREHLTSLLIEEQGIADPGGALHLSRVLTPERYEVLQRLPFPQPERSEVIAAHAAYARAFMPRARKLAAAQGVLWPEAFEAATLRHLRDELGPEVDWSG
jgi:predicted nucleotidyltransferase